MGKKFGFGKAALTVACGLAVCLAAFAGYLTATEYRPEEVEELEAIGGAGKPLSVEDKLTIVSYNMGYGCNSADADFFMDGGTMVRAKSKEDVERNIQGLMETLKSLDADVAFLQELDMDSKRAYGLNEVQAVADYFEEESSACFAANFICKYIPYPLPETIGRVKGGLVTLNQFAVKEASRHNLPCSYSWPIRLCQLKRGLLVERVSLADKDKEVVFVNLHLEAYADGEKKMAQTKVLLELLQSEYEKGNYVIAGGDFNQSFPGVDVEAAYPIVDQEHYVPETMEEGLLPGDWSWAADISTPSARLLNEPYQADSKKTQYYVIDGFILSPNVKLEEIKNIDTGFAYSDHNPVFLKISFQ